MTSTGSIKQHSQDISKLATAAQRPCVRPAPSWPGCAPPHSVCYQRPSLFGREVCRACVRVFTPHGRRPLNRDGPEFPVEQGVHWSLPLSGRKWPCEGEDTVARHVQRLDSTDLQLR